MRPETFSVIAHRGASGYLPEHTLEGAAMAHGMGADYVELDLVMTADDQLVVLHDLWLDFVTDVAARYPGRQRPDGRHYAVDFSLEEIRELRVNERRQEDGTAAWPGRFPLQGGDFRVPGLDDMMQLVQGMNDASGRECGIYIEPKRPFWHETEGKDILEATVERLFRFGYRTRSDMAILQSFDPPSLNRLRRDLGCELQLVQLIGENDWGESEVDMEAMRSPDGLARIADYADGIGPWLLHLARFKLGESSDISDIVQHAHAVGLFVHPYTLRADQLPPGVPDLPAAMDILAAIERVDGVFTDHPDQVCAWLESGS